MAQYELILHHRHGVDTSRYESEEAATKSLFGYVCEWWNDLYERNGWLSDQEIKAWDQAAEEWDNLQLNGVILGDFYPLMPQDMQEAIDFFYEHASDEDYEIHLVLF